MDTLHHGESGPVSLATGGPGEGDTASVLRESVRRHRVHFEVRPEVDILGEVRLKVGYQLRLWAVHDRGAHVLPGCPRCGDLLTELERIVQWVMPPGGRPTRVEYERTGPALYDSQVVPGADEVALLVRLTHQGDYRAPIDACEERCLKEMRERLRGLGIPER